MRLLLISLFFAVSLLSAGCGSAGNVTVSTTTTSTTLGTSTTTTGGATTTAASTSTSSSTLTTAPTTTTSLAPTTTIPAGGFAPLRRVYPSAHVLYHYYAPNVSSADKAEVAARASIINHGEPSCLANLAAAQPGISELVNIRYRLIQYVQYAGIDDNELNPTGQVDLASLEAFASANGYALEDFFLHWSEPTRIEHLGATIECDGTTTILTAQDGTTREVANNRAMAIVWSDFYYVFDWHDGSHWYDYIKWRMEQELAQTYNGVSFSGYFEDVLNGPITDTYQGIVSGGGISEFGGQTPTEITAAEADHDLILAAQAALQADFPTKIFMPNSGNYTQAWALETMLAGSGTITEATNGVGSQIWDKFWANAKAVAAAGKYYSVSQYWDDAHVPSASDYPAGIYDSGKERMYLDHAASYWMAYEPGYVAFDIMDSAAGGWATTHPFPAVMETDLGSPAGEPYLADSGTTASGWHWTLWGRNYSSGAAVYFRGNSAWRGGNGASDYTAGLAAPFTPEAGAQMLKMDGSWTAAPAVIDHMDSFGFVLY